MLSTVHSVNKLLCIKTIIQFILFPFEFRYMCLSVLQYKVKSVFGVSYC